MGVIGQQERLPDDVRAALDKTLELTRNNRAMRLNLALSYGGREELTRAVRHIARKVQRGELSLTDISQETVSRHLYTAGQPDPDLIIRTSGEQRLSNFLLWQAGYAEFFFP